MGGGSEIDGHIFYEFVGFHGNIFKLINSFWNWYKKIRENAQI